MPSALEGRRAFERTRRPDEASIFIRFVHGKGLPVGTISRAGWISFSFARAGRTEIERRWELALSSIDLPSSSVTLIL